MSWLYTVAFDCLYQPQRRITVRARGHVSAERIARLALRLEIGDRDSGAYTVSSVTVGAYGERLEPPA